MEKEKKLAPLSDKMKGAIRFLQANEGAHFCADIAASMGLEAKQLSPVLTALTKRGLVTVAGEGQREVVNSKGEKKINNYKMYELTDAGIAEIVED